MNPHDLIVKGLTSSQALLHRFVADLQPQEFLHRPADKANCEAWTIGHLVLSERSCLSKLGVRDLPPLPDGFETRFSQKDGCPQASEFGDPSVLMPLFDAHRHLLIESVKWATPDLLAKPLEKPHAMFANPGELAQFMTIHTCMHAGQISTIRRSLGRPPLM